MKHEKPVASIGVTRWAIASVMGAVLTWLAVCQLGCTKGSRQWYEAANPETSFEVVLDPFAQTATPKFYTNDGRDLFMKNINFASNQSTGDRTFSADEISTVQHAKDIKEADAIQIQAQGIALSQIAKANWEGAAAVMKEASGLALLAKGAQSPEGQDAIKAMLQEAVKEAIKQHLKPGSAGAGEGQPPGAGAGEAPGPQTKLESRTQPPHRPAVASSGGGAARGNAATFESSESGSAAGDSPPLPGGGAAEVMAWPDDFPLAVNAMAVATANQPRRLSAHGD
jgi:hypothetical protein